MPISGEGSEGQSCLFLVRASPPGWLDRDWRQVSWLADIRLSSAFPQYPQWRGL